MGRRTGELPQEEAYRDEALLALGRALADEARARADAARVSRERAELATWLGASLADLARVTGRSRQAARQRWPSLGPIYQRRRWLSGHVEDILLAARLLLQDDTDLPPADREGLAETFTAACAELAGEAGTVGDPARRWHLLEDLVDVHLRAAGDPARGQAASDEAQFARDGAVGVVAHYDHAARAVERTPAT